MSVEGAVVICQAGFQATCLTLNVREELDNVLTKGLFQISHRIPIKGWLQISHRISHLTKGPLDGPAAQLLLLLGAGVGLGDALLALEHLGAGGEEEAGLGKGEAGKVRLMLVRRSENLPAAKYVRKAHRGSSWQAARQSLMEATT